MFLLVLKHILIYFNLFIYNNNTGITLIGTDRVMIDGNQFLNTQGIYSTGKFNNLIESNKFKNVIGITHEGNIMQPSRLTCNTLDCTGVGMYFWGRNEDFTLWNNRFNSLNDIVLNGTNNDIGFLNNQGSVSAPAKNFFTDGSSNNIVAFNTYTKAMRYTYSKPDNLINNDRNRPKCAINDINNCNLYNFYSDKSDLNAASWECPITNIVPKVVSDKDCIEIECIRKVGLEYSELDYKIRSGIATDKDWSKLEDLANRWIDATSKYKTYFLENNVDLEQYYNQLSDIPLVYREWIEYKISLYKKDEALLLLNNMNVKDLDDEYYKKVELLNLEQQEHDPCFTYPDNDTNLLNFVANSEYSSAPLAKSLLNMVNGVFFYPELPIPSAQYRYSNFAIKEFHETAKSSILVTPNPAYDNIEVIMPVGINLKGGVIKIFNSLGQQQNDSISIINSASEKVNISGYMSGIYYVLIIKDNIIISKSKFIKLID
jgi:hypothetical protein